MKVEPTVRHLFRAAGASVIRETDTTKCWHSCGLTEASVFSCLLCFLQEGTSLCFCPSAKAPLYFEQYFVQHSESTPTQNTCPENKLRKHLNSEFQYWWKEKQVPESHISSRTRCCDRKAKARGKLCSPTYHFTELWKSVMYRQLNF